MEENTRISDLFDRARNEAPKTSFDEMKGHFLATSTVAGTGILVKWAAASFKLKVIIMTSVVSILTISGVLIASQFKSTPVLEESTVEKLPQNEVEIIEVKSEDGIQKTTVYNEKREVLKVEIDSSNEAKQKAQEMRLDPEGPRTIDFQTAPKRTITSLKPPTVNPTVDSDSLVLKKFMINETTSNEEIEKIQQQAISAGLEFTYNTRIRQSKIKRLHLKMKKGGSHWSSHITGTDSFSFDFGWWEDAEGNFVRFICKKDLNIGCGDC